VASIRTPTLQLPLPSVIRLSHPVRRPRPRLKLSRRAVFRRDSYTCQYCSLQSNHFDDRSRYNRAIVAVYTRGERCQRLPVLQSAQRQQNIGRVTHDAAPQARRAECIDPWALFSLSRRIWRLGTIHFYIKTHLFLYWVKALVFLLVLPLFSASASTSFCMGG